MELLESHQHDGVVSLSLERLGGSAIGGPRVLTAVDDGDP
jgi:hypothetical protein